MSHRVRILACPAGATLPDAIGPLLRELGMGAAWVRGTGVVNEVDLRTLRNDGSVMTRRLAGPAQVVSLEGAIGARSELGLSVILARETDRGPETLAGSLVRAQVVSLELVAIDLESRAEPSNPALEAAAPPGPSAGAPVTAASPPIIANTAAAPSAALPPKIVRPAAVDQADAPFPEEGDVVEHFAFGTCDVLKSDGDRIHLRVHRDQRIKEIAPEMLRVIPLDLASKPRRFKLERKI